MAQGLAVFAMLMLHLFCRKGELPYDAHLFIGDTPLIYYFGLFGDICVPIYCFCSGYAQMVLMEKEKTKYCPNSMKRAWRFLKHFFIFAAIGLIVGVSNTIPGSWKTLLENLLLFRFSYNGAWWFVATWLLLLLAAPILRRIVKKIHPVIVLGISGGGYVIAYAFRFIYVLKWEVEIINWGWNQIILFGTSQFGFVIGMLFYKYDILGKIDKKLKDSKVRVLSVFLLPILMFIIHCIWQSLIIAPIMGIVTLSCFHLWRKSK